MFILYPIKKRYIQKKDQTDTCCGEVYPTITAAATR
jgi:hypothetical protein